MKLGRKVWFVLFSLGVFLAGCSPSSRSFLDPHSIISSHEASLYRDVLIEAITIFIVVITALLWLLIRYRNRKGDKSIPPQTYGKLSWVALPVLLIVALDGMDFVWMAQTMHDVAAPAPAVSDLHLQVQGHRWWWEFDYPDLGIKTANELHVPVGTTVQIDLGSVDVIHSFWIPQLTGKTDAIPGQTNHMWFKADKIGTFYGQCAEFCGTNHANMRIVVVVESQDDFNTWVANQQKPVAQPQTPQEQQGYKIITTGICSNCHTLNDTKAQGQVGPNLTHLYSRSVFAGATLQLNDQNIRLWLQNTQALKPGNDMVVNLSPDEIDALTAYLKLLK